MSKRSGERGITKKPNNDRAKLVIELIFAILLSVSCALMGMSNLLFASNADYPYTVDGFGHMTKVVYIAGQLAQGHIPSWFPYWYNNSTTTQYYVPLSYYLMAPIYMITNNVMLTYKIFCTSVMAIGAFGVWVTCYKKIGRVCGLFGIIMFSFQPVLLDSLYKSGVVAQGPIIALMPWFFLAVFSCAEKPKKGNFAASTLVMTLIILSHAMHAFMIFLTTAMVLFIFLVMKKVKFRNLLIASLTVVLAAFLTAFWSVVGSTQLENEGVPYLLPEATDIYTSNLNWFYPGNKAIFYFSMVTSALILLAAVIYFIAYLLKKNSQQSIFYANAAILLSIITIVFSFGKNIPGFRLLPMSGSIVAGRILTYTSVSAAIAAAYAVRMLWKVTKLKSLIRPFVLAVILFSVWEMEPYAETYEILPSDYYLSTARYLDDTNTNFNKGRYQWYGPVNSSESFFPVQYDYNLSDGWNIEGTVHNQELWNNNIALSVGDEDYTIKQIAYWNVRSLLIYDQFKSLAERLLTPEFGFEKVMQRKEGGFYASNKPSSYYLTDSRNAMVISSSTQGFNIEYPNFILGKSADISKYSLDELTKYKLVYIIEPELNTLSQKNELETKITQLVNAGINVIVEPAATRNFELFGINTRDENYQSTPYITPTQDCPFAINGSELTANSNISVIRTLHGLDETYMNLTFEGSKINNAIMGTKKVGNGKVIFLGAHLSQYLKPVYARNFGLELVNTTIKENSIKVEAIFDSIFSYYGVNSDYLPQNYGGVISHSWNYKGGEFTYQSKEDKEVTLSISYSPRWSATLDGNKIRVGQCENLMTLELPSGEHTVKLHYGITVYGMIGYIISGIGALFFLLFLSLWKWNMKAISNISDKLMNYLQIERSGNKTDSMEQSDVVSQIQMEAASETAAAVTEEEHLELIDGCEEGIIAESPKEPDEINASMQQNTDKDEQSPFKFYHTFHENGVMVEVIEIEEDEEPALEDGTLNKIGIESFSLTDKEQEASSEAAISEEAEQEVISETTITEEAVQEAISVEAVTEEAVQEVISEEVVTEEAVQEVISEEVVTEEAFSEVETVAETDSGCTEDLSDTGEESSKEPYNRSEECEAVNYNDIDFDSIIKKARYESQRKWLRDYYETLMENKKVL